MRKSMVNPNILQKSQEFSNLRKSMRFQQLRENKPTPTMLQSRLLESRIQETPEIDDPNRQHLEDFFRAFSFNGKEQIKIISILETCKSIKMEASRVEHLEYTLRKVARGKSLISFDDLRAVLAVCEGNKSADAAVIFKQADYDHAGRLDLNKLRIFFQEHGLEIGDREIKSMIQLVSQDGSIDLEQFTRAISMTS